MSLELKVERSYNDDGFCREVFNVLEITNTERDETKEVKKIRICRQEEATDYFVWYSLAWDDAWDEPQSPIKADTTIHVSNENKLFTITKGGVEAK